MFFDLSAIAYLEGDPESAGAFLEIAENLVKIGADIALDMSPVGRVKGFVEAFSGRSVIPPDFAELSTANRALALIGAVTVGKTGLKLIGTVG